MSLKITHYKRRKIVETFCTIIEMCQEGFVMSCQNEEGIQQTIVYSDTVIKIESV